jgi:hypothetical protein
MSDPKSNDEQQKRHEEAEEAMSDDVRREIKEAANLPDPTKWQTYGRPPKAKDA